jgi:osmotically inducible protein OsmC
MRRTARAEWNGNLKEGAGSFGVGSGAFSAQGYSYRTRFEDAPGTNPEELTAAAHASCFSMALAGQLAERGLTPKQVATQAVITFEGGTLLRSALTTTVKAPGADRARVEEAAEAAKTGCPISRALKLEITLELSVEG